MSTLDTDNKLKKLRFPLLLRASSSLRCAVFPPSLTPCSAVGAVPQRLFWFAPNTRRGFWNCHSTDGTNSTKQPHRVGLRSEQASWNPIRSSHS